jgi:hypothetical protein
MSPSNNDLYPGFGSKSPLAGRLRRLETGAQRLQGNQVRFSAGGYRRLIADLMDEDQSISLVSSRIRKKGGVSVSGNTSGFAYTSTDSSITWYWDGTNGSHVIVIHRADGSHFTVPTGGSPLTISGLSASTTYYFLPFWDVRNTCNIGWVPGTAGTPQIAFVANDTTDPVNSQIYLVSQTTQSREALSGGYMSAITAGAGGSGGGTGGNGGQPGHCVRAGTTIEPLGSTDYEVKVHGNSEWVWLTGENGKTLFCTADHPLYHARQGKVSADSLTEGDILITDTGEQKLVQVGWIKVACSLWEVHMPKGHLFWANGFLSHNKVAMNL